MKLQFALLSSATLLAVSSASSISLAQQELLPEDNGIAEYHRTPEWNEGESHPLRVLSYVFHPIGWVAREAIFRPLSYFASSTPTRRSVMGYKAPFTSRHGICFRNDGVPDCRRVPPFDYDNYERHESKVVSPEESTPREIVFPHVNFEFNRSSLNETGIEKVKEVAKLLNESGHLIGPVVVLLEGHTDYLGSDKYNERLGLKRAETVMKALAQAGIAPEKMKTQSFGEKQPHIDEKSAAARSANRRVEVRVRK
jgi:outer membrane protein OmpA-like peptidoglycan-associated protein